MTLRPILDYHDQWGWIRNGLLHCQHKTGDRTLPEDVYHALKIGAAFCFAFADAAGEDVGFVVLQRHDDTDGACLFILALWAEPGAARSHEAEVYRLLETKALEVGARRLRMQSSRRAWQRERYWTETARVYEHEVTP